MSVWVRLGNKEGKKSVVERLQLNKLEYSERRNKNSPEEKNGNKDRSGLSKKSAMTKNSLRIEELDKLVSGTPHVTIEVPDS